MADDVSVPSAQRPRVQGCRRRPQAQALWSVRLSKTAAPSFSLADCTVLGSRSIQAFREGKTPNNK